GQRDVPRVVDRDAVAEDGVVAGSNAEGAARRERVRAHEEGVEPADEVEDDDRRTVRRGARVADPSGEPAGETRPGERARAGPEPFQETATRESSFHRRLLSRSKSP